MIINAHQEDLIARALPRYLPACHPKVKVMLDSRVPCHLRPQASSISTAEDTCHDLGKARHIVPGEPVWHCCVVVGQGIS
ncbi:hypothetical protein J6590_031575 [Homalodisca vitripennis]|nr:hypothetical protein J6590_031575 [Homalodisca vitripennis]